MSGINLLQQTRFHSHVSHLLPVNAGQADDYPSGPATVPCLESGNSRNHRTPLSRSGARVLLADEDPGYLKSLGTTMGMIGFARLDLVSTGADAISALYSKEYDIVILDVEMRGASGFYLARALRKHCARTMRVQPLVIVCTGLLPFCYEETATRSGADYSFYKPLSKDRLHRVFTDNAII